ncbi:hypothetical protein [Vulcanisaeta distributa]|uniref:SWIM-type domain-containing protein n=1 Tax=Vulcanisaeta distributa (strain DSM 14429 / JCM 11212 / NBRC 100878 / IC-017) TaxID=572478 RepID=E1QSJ0_VULDI|nr:hypothetical protein [Vulcanisaeta distributa]ADN50783.1 hypothetical protein Vdis_1397 [Vulcanisaeta distributa DSM 14429]
MVSKDVVFDEVRKVGREWVIRGRVKSRSRPNTWHSVEARIRRLESGEVTMVGKCDCEAFTRGHMVCWHMLHLTNVFIRNRRRLVRGLGISVN